jgi:aspartate aminotransferase
MGQSLPLYQQHLLVVDIYLKFGKTQPHKGTFMSDIISKRANSIKPSATLALTIKATELKAKGEDVIALNVGEPDFDTPDNIKQAAIKAINDGQTKYTTVDGTMALRKAISTKFSRENQLSYEPSQILVSDGAKHSIFNALMAIVDEGDEVVIPAPYWVSYPDMVKLVEGAPVIVSANVNNDFKMTPEELEAAITPKTKLLMLNSPSNPSGKAYSKAQLQELGQVLLKYPDVIILTDDIYEHLLWSDEPFANIVMACPELYERTVVINGVSKAFAMTGWRIGYTAASKPIIAAMKKIQGQSTSCPSSISQAAAMEALSEKSFASIGPMVKEFKQRHDYLHGALNAIEGIKAVASDGTFYLFPDISDVIAKRDDIADDIAFAEMLMTETGIIVTPGSPFGAPGYLRFSFAADLKTLEEAVKRLSNFIAK